MKIEKLLLAVLVAAAFMFFMDWLFYSQLMVDYFTQMPTQKPMPDLPYMILGMLIFAFAFVSIYLKGVGGGTPVGEGARYGLWVTLLVFVPMGFIWYSLLSYAPLSEYLVDMLYHGVQMVIMGILVAYTTGVPSSRGDGKGGTGGDDTIKPPVG
ncbi:MAG: hypothetical protein M3R25_04530 [Bacteroidota bacterium]|nr:hypothetical protein [Bacteroidota bacterium]